MLEKYEEKRDFERTPEPPPGAQAGSGSLTFVIQKHAATRLHYDFRLEFDGVLKSWPVPKGPSLNPEDKRLAIMVEDHPLEYASFEGVIPKGEYGAGQVIVWDAGTYSPDEGGKLSFSDRDEANARMMEGLAKGKISVYLRGQKLHGSWTLVKIARGTNEWLLIKHQDQFADRERDILEEDASILSGLTLEDIKAGRLPQRRKDTLLRPADLPGAVAAEMPRSIEPMHAMLTERPFSAPGWVFEPKLDGVRCIALKDGDDVRLSSRRGLDSTRQYPSVAEQVAQQAEQQLILDGEIVALDENGIPSFQRIQQRLGLQRESDIRKAEALIPVYYYVFDILYARGFDLRGVPLHSRRRMLEQLLVPTEGLLLLDAFDEGGEEAFEGVKEVGLEGLIAKQVDSLYEPGKRSGRWRKIKTTMEQEFVVGGFTQGEGGRSGTFGSLLLGYYDGDKGDRLTYVGNVGTGFDDRTLRSLREKLDALRTDEQPFAGPLTRGRMVFGRPREGPITWVRPELIAEVRFAQWTDDGHLRAPSFLGLREDKAPREVRREEAIPPPEKTSPASGASAPVEGEVEAVLEQLEDTKDKLLLKVSDHTISLTNLDKPLWPPLDDRRALTKRDLLVYLARVSPFLIPHMSDRPITLTRYPDGISGPHFYQKHWEHKLPKFVETVSLYSEHNDEDGEYLMCNNLPTLLWLGQLADIELHTWYSRVNAEPDGQHLPETYAGSEEKIDASRLNYPDFMVFDLDPYIYSGKESKGAEPELNRKAFLKTCDVAFWVKDVLDSLSLSSFIKTTGKTGLHIYVPILRQFDYDAVRSACETIGRFVLQAHPKDVTMEWSVPKRAGKIFFDHNQNVRGKTLASVYSPRPSPEGAVSMPVRWDELRDIYPTDFTILTALARLEDTGDLWAEILDHKHDLAGLLGV
jgi:bifunctional non-homologous end joining protein LigD